MVVPVVVPEIPITRVVKKSSVIGSNNRRAVFLVYQQTFPSLVSSGPVVSSRDDSRKRVWSTGGMTPV